MIVGSVVCKLYKISTHHFFLLFFSFTLQFLFLLWFCSQPVNAQKKQAFDPVKFEADLEKFIASEVELTPAEASEFFPVYREMRKK
jgi:uncharacterized protein YpmB